MVIETSYNRAVWDLSGVARDMRVIPVAKNRLLRSIVNSNIAMQSLTEFGTRRNSYAQGEQQ
ncbi:MAG: hypothetical protein V4602_13660 [Pseudomonadota bacterium]